jgi:hypothetical protein
MMGMDNDAKHLQPWLNFPMGAAANERLRRSTGKPAFLSHAVLPPYGGREGSPKALCGVQTFSLCMDVSQADTEPPDCPRCHAALTRRGLLAQSSP